MITSIPQEEHERSRALRTRDITLMKVILCSGLYPNFAIADEHNSYKADSEQAFHTRVGYITLIL